MRKLMWFTVGGAAACAASAYLLQNQNLSVFAVACVMLTALFLILSYVSAWAKPLAALFLGAAVLFAWFFSYQSFYLSPVRQLHGTTQQLTVTLTQYSWETKYGTGIEGFTELENKTYRVRCYVNEKLALKPGDSVVGVFELEDNRLDPYYNYQVGNGCMLQAYPAGEIYHRVSPEIPWYGYPAYLSASIKGLLYNAFPADTLAFAQALLLGDTELIDYETDTAFKLSGIRHIIAVSGLHVSILFSLVYAITGRRKWLTMLLGFPTLLLFAAIAGFTPSVNRACIMHGLMMTAMLFEREYDPPTALSFAVLIMLLANPYCICSVSLQLSAGCVGGILLFSGRISAWLMDAGRLGKLKGLPGRLTGWLSSSISVSVSATLITTPLCALYFGTVSLVSPLTNLLTLWVVSFIFYGIMLSALLSAVFAPLGAAVAWLISWPMRYVLAVSKLLADFPLAAVYTVSIYVVLFLLLCYCLLAVFLLMKRKRPGLLLGCMALGLSIALTASWTEYMLDDVRMTVLDVGQGQCILLQSDGKTFMVDCGGSSDTGAADSAAEMLLSMGIFRLDGIILTHYDRDHAGGTEKLLTRIDAAKLYLPDCLDAEGYSEPLLSHPNAFVVDSNTTISFGDTVITLVTTEFGATSNESGLCVLFQSENCDILITGDRNIYGEHDLLREIDLPKLDVLIVGHHGSRHSTSAALLDATRPDIAIISVGRNSFGHPTQEVLSLLAQYCCEIYRTDQNGTIIFRR